MFWLVLSPETLLLNINGFSLLKHRLHEYSLGVYFHIFSMVVQLGNTSVYFGVEGFQKTQNLPGMEGIFVNALIYIHTLLKNCTSVSLSGVSP